MASETGARRPRTEPREVRRRQLIDATIEAIAANGVTGTTMATVARLADLSMGSVAFHFRSKDNLFAETLAHLAEEHRAQWVESVDNAALAPEAKLAALIDAHFHPRICTPEKIAVWFAFFGEPRYRAAYCAHAARFDTERFEITERLCRRIVEDGRYAGIDPEETTKALEGLADGLWLSILTYPGWLTPEAARACIFGYLASLFPRHFPYRAAPPRSCGACAS